MLSCRRGEQSRSLHRVARSTVIERTISAGRNLHYQINARWKEGNSFLNNCLLHMYGKCGSLQEAHNLFRRIKAPNIYSWNFMIAAYAKRGHGTEALQLYKQMLAEGVLPSTYTFSALLSVCAGVRSLAVGKSIHQFIVSSGLQMDTSLRIALINMYVKCGDPTRAMAVCNLTHERDVILWTSLITAFCKTGHPKMALQVFRQMESKGIKADKVAFFSTLEACAQLGLLENGRPIHGRIMESQLSADVSIGNALINMYGKCGSPRDARVVFDNMGERDVVSWTSMIAAYAQNGQSSKGLEIFREMELEGILPNSITFLTVIGACASLATLENARVANERIVASSLDVDLAIRTGLVNMYGKCGNLKDARKTFDETQGRDEILWNTMLAAYAQNGHGKEVLKLFSKMELENVMPNTITFLITLEACASLAALENGRVIHEHIVACGLDQDVALRNAIVNMYGKCGSLKDAEIVFKETQRHNVISLVSMSLAYAQNGHPKKGIELFRKLNFKSIKPCRTTLLNILDACGQLVCLKSGRAVYNWIVRSGFDSDAIVMTALVSMFGKCGGLKDAQMIFNEMCNRNVISWTAMISRYVQNGYGKKGLQLFRKMELEGVKPNTVTFIIILDACAALTSLESGRLMHGHIIADGFDSDVTLKNALVNMYSRCGSLKDSQLVFDEINERDIVSWNSIMVAYAEHGHVMEIFELLKQMDSQGTTPTRSIFMSIINGCSHAGLLDVGCHCFVSMNIDYNIMPLKKHYVYLSGLLGRAEYRDEAEDFVLNMPFQDNAASWTTGLTSCKRL